MRMGMRWAGCQAAHRTPPREPVTPQFHARSPPQPCLSGPPCKTMRSVIPADAFRDQPTLTAPRVRLEPLGPSVLEGYLAALDDPEVRRLTGAHAIFTRTGVEAWLSTRGEHHDRADWAVVR